MERLPTDSSVAFFDFNNAGMKEFFATDEQPIIPKFSFVVIFSVYTMLTLIGF